MKAELGVMVPSAKASCAAPKPATAPESVSLWALAVPIDDDCALLFSDATKRPPLLAALAVSRPLPPVPVAIASACWPNPAIDDAAALAAPIEEPVPPPAVAAAVAAPPLLTAVAVADPAPPAAVAPPVSVPPAPP